jgi:D-alanine-D-alanine ligase
MRVAIVFGGRSSEHEISLRSALSVIKALNSAYELIAVGITRAGQWRYMPEPAGTLERIVAARGQLSEHGGISTDLVRADGAGTQTIDAVSPIAVDVVFPLLHGSFGEDGTIQGLLEMKGLPYVGSGVLGSAIGMDKAIQKRLLAAAGVPVVEFGAVRRRDYERDPRSVIALARQLGYPVFIKPNALGSSIGMTRVTAEEALYGALDHAFRYDRTALIEAACEGREFECSVLGNDEPQASLPGEIIVSSRHDFYSYDSKYLDDQGARYAIPADLPAPVAERIQALSRAAFQALGLRGMARVDFLASADLGRLVVGEVNTIPGFTSISMYPKLWEVSGLPLARLLDRLIELALEEHRERQRLEVNYLPIGSRG